MTKEAVKPITERHDYPKDRSSAFAFVLAMALRDIERVSPLLGRVARATVDNCNAEMARLNHRDPS